MEEGDSSTDSMNTINTLWLKNIYENLKNLENQERLARNGCTNLEIYAQLVSQFTPHELAVHMNKIQLQNLKMMISEMHLLLTDLTPILNSELLSRIHNSLDSIEQFSRKKNYLLIENHSLPKNKIIHSELSTDFYIFVDMLAKMRRFIIKDIEPILFTQNISENKESTKFYNG